MRKFIFYLFILITLLPTAQFSVQKGHAQERDEKLYFIAIAWIKPDQQARYDEFVQAIKPVWARHNMEVVFRSQVIDTMISPAHLTPPK
ncbi:MAG: hypothetical protein GKR97_02875 [Rhizobiaceae bacterium]|nr:hypothetical protein [Rhizobiaceae bacterium]